MGENAKELLAEIGARLVCPPEWNCKKVEEGFEYSRYDKRLLLKAESHKDSASEIVLQEWDISYSKEWKTIYNRHAYMFYYDPMIRQSTHEDVQHWLDREARPRMYKFQYRENSYEWIVAHRIHEALIQADNIISKSCAEDSKDAELILYFEERDSYDGEREFLIATKKRNKDYIVGYEEWVLTRDGEEMKGQRI